MCPLGGVSECQGHILHQLFKVGISPSSLLASTKHVHRHLTQALLCCINYQSLVPSIIITWTLVINTNHWVTKTNKIRNSRWGAQKFSNWSWSTLKFDSYCNPTTTWVTSIFTSVTHVALWPLCSLIFSILMTFPFQPATPTSQFCQIQNSFMSIVWKHPIQASQSLYLCTLCAFLEWWQILWCLQVDKERPALYSSESKIFLPDLSLKLLIYTSNARSKLHLDIPLVSHSNMSKN